MVSNTLFKISWRHQKLFSQFVIYSILQIFFLLTRVVQRLIRISSWGWSAGVIVNDENPRTPAACLPTSPAIPHSAPTAHTTSRRKWRSSTWFINKNTTPIEGPKEIFYSDAHKKKIHQWWVKVWWRYPTASKVFHLLRNRLLVTRLDTVKTFKRVGHSVFVCDNQLGTRGRSRGRALQQRRCATEGVFFVLCQPHNFSS